MKSSYEEVEALLRRLEAEARHSGYHLNPDRDFTRGLVEALLVNTRRYGYPSCPCRLAAGDRSEDLDIICPCDYRDPDLSQYGACYCALYVSAQIARGQRAAEPIPERRPPREKGADPPEGEREKGARTAAHPHASSPSRGLAYPVWRCRVCGYLCARDEPPEKCPVCKADKDRFELFLT